MDPSTRAREDDEEAPPGTESSEIRPLSEEDDTEIVSSGQRAEEPPEEPATADMYTPRVGAVATEFKEQWDTDQGRSPTQVVRGQGIRLPSAATTQQTSA
jgi:hypothetical protein